MKISIRGANDHNLRGVDVDFDEGLTVVTGVSGSGKTSLVFDTLYHEARRRFLDIYMLGSAASRLAPARVESITGLGPAVAVGQNLLNRNPNSTLATASGLHPYLRLLFARFGERTCTSCGSSLLVFSEDEIVEKLLSLSKIHTLTLNAPLLTGIPGTHRTLLNTLERQFDPHVLLVDGETWDGHALNPELPHSIELQLAVLDSDSTAQGIRHAVRQAAAFGVHFVTARWNGCIQNLARAPVCSLCGKWFVDLRPVDFNQECQACGGKGCAACQETGLPPQAAAVRWDDLHLPDLLALSVDEVRLHFQPSSPAYLPIRLRQEIDRRLEALQQVGLGYIDLNRPSPSLSRGEAQRVRLAVTLISRLEDMLHVLDEPTVGQHPADVQRLLPVFRRLAGPVIFVEHDRAAAAGADQAVDMGPGAGSQGGRVIFQGPPARLWEAETPTGLYFSGRSQPMLPAKQLVPEHFLKFSGAYLRTLQNLTISIPLGRLTVISGVSGSGKSTLVEDVIVASLEASRPTGCLKVDGPKMAAVMVDQSPIGRNPRSNPATYTGLADLVRDLFAQATGLSASHFSFNRPQGACPTCQGLGAVEVPMRYLPSTWLPCSDCEGQRFSDEVLAARVDFNGLSLSIADFLSLTITEIGPLVREQAYLSPASKEAALRILAALEDIGLGYLPLGQSSPTLSGGEAQRIKLARYLGRKSLARQLLVLDEPSTGLHPQDLDGLLVVLNRLVQSGATIIMVEHNPDLIRAADWLVDLGPGAGGQGGRLLYAGPPEGLENTPTGLALQNERQLKPDPSPGRQYPGASQVISIRGARSHNLQNVDVDIPKGFLTVITGVSGSGKSSLVKDVLEVEARRRFLETLSMYERQGTREAYEAEVEAITGLGVALSIGPERLVYSRRATVGTATELSSYLAVLLASLGDQACPQCGAAMQRTEHWTCPVCQATLPAARPRHFSSLNYASACLHCSGVGTLQKPQPAKLIVRPQKPLCSGAMYSPGFFPNGYLGQPYNHGYYLLQALGQRFGFDPHATPWNEMSPEAQQAFLFGDPRPMTVTVVGRSGIEKTYDSPFPGFYGFIRDWDVGGTYSEAVACPACHGDRLRPEYLAVTLSGRSFPALNRMPLAELAGVVDTLHMPGTAPSWITGSWDTMRRRLRFLSQVGLGYLHLEREAGTLSAGEVQRVRLASLLASGLTSLTLLLDEPTRGLHPAEVEALLSALFELRQEGNTVIVVEHDPLIMRAADHLIDMGPGAGRNGGKVVAQGHPDLVLSQNTPTAAWLRGEQRMDLKRKTRQPSSWLTIHGARANNLQGERVDLPLGMLTGICGLSGSGKSTLIIDTLGRALAPKKQTTSVAYEPVEPGLYDSIDGAPGRTLLIDQARAGITSPAAFLGLDRRLRSLFAASDDALALGITSSQLEASCSVCSGRGVITVDMAFLPDIHTPCEVCRGTGHLAEAWEVRLHGLSLPEIYPLTIDEVYELFGSDEHLARPLQAARKVGLGYLVLRQPGYALSGGEAQRLKIAAELARKTTPQTLYLMDEPTVGLHLEDVRRLADVLHTMVKETSSSVIVVEHHPHLLAVCDWLIELGPGGGPQGGRVIAAGTPSDLAVGSTPIAPFLRSVLEAGL